MLPTLEPGDRLLVCRMPLRPGDLVAVEDPERAGMALVKRLAAVEGGRLRLAGDNAGASRDSRRFGTVAAAAAWGRAVYRYHPPSRSGWLVCRRREPAP